MRTALRHGRTLKSYNITSGLMQREAVFLSVVSVLAVVERVQDIQSQQKVKHIIVQEMYGVVDLSCT